MFGIGIKARVVPKVPSSKDAVVASGMQRFVAEPNKARDQFEWVEYRDPNEYTHDMFMEEPGPFSIKAFGKKKREK